MLKVVHFSSEFGAGGLCAYGFGSDSTVSHLLPPHSVLFGVLALLTYALGSFCVAAPPSYCFTYFGRILFGKLSEEKSTLVSKVLLGGFELCVNRPGGSGETVQNREGGAKRRGDYYLISPFPLPALLTNAMHQRSPFQRQCNRNTSTSRAKGRVTLAGQEWESAQLATSLVDTVHFPFPIAFGGRGGGGGGGGERW